MKIHEFLEQYGIRYVSSGEHHHARPGWLNLDCPFCSPASSKFRLGYNLYGKYFNCWTCGPQRTGQTLAELTGQPLSKVKLIFDIVERDAKWETADERGKLQYPVGLGPLRQQHEEYLRSRNFDPDTLREHWGLRGFGPVSGIYSWRIFVPYTFDGNVVSWTSRSIATKPDRRYLSAPPSMEVFSPKHFLYGEDYCKSSMIVVCEGPADVWRLGPGATAIMGLGYSRRQLLRIARYPKRIICFDTDEPGQRRAEMICNELGPFQGNTFNVVLDAPDPGSASVKMVRKFWETVGR